MNKLVREHYPVSNLPEDLREGFGVDASVRVTIVADEADEEQAGHLGDALVGGGTFDAAELMRRGEALRVVNYQSGKEIDDYVRSLRE